MITVYWFFLIVTVIWLSEIGKIWVSWHFGGALWFSSLWCPFDWNWLYLGFLDIIWRMCGSKWRGGNGGIFPTLCVEFYLVFYFILYLISNIMLMLIQIYVTQYIQFPLMICIHIFCHCCCMYHDCIMHLIYLGAVGLIANVPCWLQPILNKIHHILSSPFFAGKPLVSDGFPE